MQLGNPHAPYVSAMPEVPSGGYHLLGRNDLCRDVMNSPRNAGSIRTIEELCK